VAGVETGLPCRHYVLPHRTTLVDVVVLYVHVNVRVKRMQQTVAGQQFARHVICELRALVLPRLLFDLPWCFAFALQNQEAPPCCWGPRRSLH
jgi:hypothetical protein